MLVAENEILFIYKSDDLHERSALAYASAGGEYELKEFDLTRDFLTERQLVEISQKLAVPLTQLFADSVDHVDYPEQDIPGILVNNHKLMKTPIAVYHDHAEFIQSPHDVVSNNVQMKYPAVKDPGDSRSNQ